MTETLKIVFPEKFLTENNQLKYASNEVLQGYFAIVINQFMTQTQFWGVYFWFGAIRPNKAKTSN